MATRPSTIAHLLDQLSGIGNVTARKIFGEYGLFFNDRMVALVCDDQLYVKLTLGGRAFVGTCAEGVPYPGAKPCLLIPGEKWDDREWLVELLRITGRELPQPKKKTG